VIPLDKFVGRRRKILQTIDTTELLREFARWCALQVIDLWDCPPIVREYLETGREEIQAAARAAGWEEARATARRRHGDGMGGGTGGGTGDGIGGRHWRHSDENSRRWSTRRSKGRKTLDATGRRGRMMFRWNYQI